MKHLKENTTFKEHLRHIYLSYIPNKRDNLGQIIIKLIFIVSSIALIVSSCFLGNYFIEADRQKDIIDNSRAIWHISSSSQADDTAEKKPDETATETLTAKNEDFKGWITLSHTQIDNPIFQTDNNDFYLNHNQNKRRSSYGALYFDYRNKISENETDKNLVIYGHEMNNGSMFGELKKLRTLSFYKQNPTIEFSTIYHSSTYKIYSIFILNGDKADDNGYIYNIYRKEFLNESDFDAWAGEAIERSIINTGVDVEMGDNIITLVTCSKDFENSRLVVMAREVRADEETAVDTSIASVNPNPRYPAKWYSERGIEYK